MKNTISNPLFKSYLGKSPAYLGGKSVHEIKSKAEKIHKLSSNENAVGPSPKAVEAIKAYADGLHIYPDRTDRRLIEALTRYYDNELSEINFFAANSGSECLEYIIRAFMGEGNECITCDPSFGLYKLLVKWVGGKTINVPLVGENFDLDVEGVLARITDQTRLIFVTSPNNPTGTYTKRQHLEQLLAKLPKHVVLVYDEVYYLYSDAEDYSIAMPYVKAGHQIIGLNSFSKSYGLAGLRLGYFYSTPELTEYVRGMTRPFLINALSLQAGVAALSDTSYLKEVVDLVQEGKAYLYPELDKLPVKYWKTQGNFIMIKSAMPAVQLEEKLIYEAGVMVRPVGNFGADEYCFRVTIGTMEANEAFIRGLKMVL